MLGTVQAQREAVQKPGPTAFLSHSSASAQGWDPALIHPEEEPPIEEVIEALGSPLGLSDQGKALPRPLLPSHDHFSMSRSSRGGAPVLHPPAPSSLG